MTATSQIRKLVSQYLVREIDLNAFAKNFAEQSCDIEDCGEQDAIRLSYSIESELAKHAEGLFGESVLRNSLIACIQADVSQNLNFSRAEIEPKRDESQNAGVTIVASESFDALSTV